MKKKVCVTIFLFVMLTSFCSTWAQEVPQPAKSPWITSSTTIIRFKNDDYKESLAFSDDGKYWAYNRKTPTGVVIVSNAGIYDALPGGYNIVWSPKTNHLFFWVEISIDAYALVANGKKQDSSFIRPQPIVFSADGQRWGIAACRPTGKITGHINQQPIKETQVVVVIDGKEIGHYKEATNPTFSPDSAHFAYLAKDGNQMILVVDGKTAKSFERADFSWTSEMTRFFYVPNLSYATRMIYLPDGSLILLAHSKDGWGIYHGDALLHTAPALVLRFGNNIYYMQAEESADKRAIYVESIRASQNGSSIAWWESIDGSDKKKAQVFLNGKSVEPISQARVAHSSLWLSKDGSKLAYGAAVRDEGHNIIGFDIVCNGKILRRVPFRKIYNLSFSHDGKHHVFLGEKLTGNDLYLVRDGVVFPQAFESCINPVYSLDSSHVACAIKKGGDSSLGWNVVLDDWVSETYDEIVWGPKFTSEGYLRYIALTDDQVKDVTIKKAEK